MDPNSKPSSKARSVGYRMLDNLQHLLWMLEVSTEAIDETIKAHLAWRNWIIRYTPKDKIGGPKTHAKTR